MNYGQTGQGPPLRTTVLVAVLALAWGGIGCGTDAPDNGASDLRLLLRNITPAQAQTLIQDNENSQDFIIIDVRTAAEYSSEQITGAINLNFWSLTFRDDLDALDRDKTYLIYCESGIRGGQALLIMEDFGFASVYNLAGGIRLWQLEGYPVV